jgi:hypothetical protein
MASRFSCKSKNFQNYCSEPQKQRAITEQKEAVGSIYLELECEDVLYDDTFFHTDNYDNFDDANKEQL